MTPGAIKAPPELLNCLRSSRSQRLIGRPESLRFQGRLLEGCLLFRQGAAQLLTLSVCIGKGSTGVGNVTEGLVLCDGLLTM